MVLGLSPRACNLYVERLRSQHCGPDLLFKTALPDVIMPMFPLVCLAVHWTCAVSFAGSSWVSYNKQTSLANTHIEWPRICITFQNDWEWCQYAVKAWSKYAKWQGQTKDLECPCSDHLEANSWIQAVHTASCQSEFLGNYRQARTYLQ